MKILQMKSMSTGWHCALDASSHVSHMELTGENVERTFGANDRKTCSHEVRKLKANIT